jgi:NAD(P)-dependent dehydrogenase (short-subunit alcohol dehydrogenase family)
LTVEWPPVDDAAAVRGAQTQGKTVATTGATSDIGAVVAESLAALGARIVFAAGVKDRADETLAPLNAKEPQYPVYA